MWVICQEINDVKGMDPIKKPQNAILTLICKWYWSMIWYPLILAAKIFLLHCKGMTHFHTGFWEYKEQA